MPTPSSCPDRLDYERLFDGRLPSAAADVLEGHLLECPACVQAVRPLGDASPLAVALRRDPATAEVPDGPEVERLVRQVRELAAQVTTSLPEPATLPPAPVAAGESHPYLRPAQEPDELGRLGPYRVLRALGAGGMGVVFQAEDPRLQRQVALKVMKPALAANPSHCQRFLREARAAAAVEHDHLVTVYEVGEADGAPYLAMPLLQGETLQSRLEREGRLPSAEVCRIGREAALGLEAAHRGGMVHRDIKPGNLWLEAQPERAPRVKILDFGLAQVARADVRLTQAGYILGTPAYMAPEQASNQPLDGRGDLYSLGVVLYECLTGRLPFSYQDPVALIAALALETPPSVRALNPEVPAPLADLVMRLLAKKPADRPPSARAVADALAMLAQPPERPRRRGFGLLAAALLGVLLAGTSWYAVRRWMPIGGWLG